MSGSGGSSRWCCSSGWGAGSATVWGLPGVGISPVVITLAMNGLMHGIALVYTEGNATRFGPPVLNWFVNGNVLGFSPVVWFLIAFIVVATLTLSRTPFGRRIYAVGCGH